MALGGVCRGVEIVLGHEVGVDVVVGHGGVLVGARYPVDAELAVGVVVAERTPQSGRLGQ